jgi:nucleoside phosphorylase
LAFLVGICGGVPFPSERTELILGDVIVSDRVVEYDFGQQYPDRFQRKGVIKETLGGLSRTVRSFLSGLKTHRMRNQLQDDLLKYLQDLQNHLDGRWKHPDTAQDQLFEACYRHKHYHQRLDTTCLCMDCQCSNDPVCEKALKNDCKTLGCMGALVPRTRLSAGCSKPHVHFGSIASGDTVMKSGEHRDQLAEIEKVIGFEMEGAGIWDNLPCIIIKGVCDYADSHKNNMWQEYAAATAASCTKAFLKYWTGAVQERKFSYFI